MLAINCHKSSARWRQHVAAWKERWREIN